MKAITKEYLGEYIYRILAPSIVIHRKSKGIPEQGEHPTDEEMLEFIRTIPYLGNGVKDFIVGNLEERAIIVSQQWENEFLIKCRNWAGSFEWLYGSRNCLTDIYLEKYRHISPQLGLPY